MPELYPIVEVQEEWALDPEFMGTKDKFWYRSPGQNTEWLFKYPRPNTGEHWAEKIASEVAGLLGIMHAKVELATSGKRVGSVTESFARRERELIHGNQILALTMSSYDLGASFGQSQHTLDNIWTALDSVFTSLGPRKAAKCRFAEYLILDALIGNTDRHHENWGVLRRRTESGWTGFLAPSFDHASSLGRELKDERRNRLLTEDRVGQYVGRGHGGIFWSEDERRGPSPLELVRLAISECPGLLQTALRRLEKVDEDSLREIVVRVQEDWMSQSAREFAIALMCYNLHDLRKAFQ